MFVNFISGDPFNLSVNYSYVVALQSFILPNIVNENLMVLGRMISFKLIRSGGSAKNRR